MAYFSLYLSTTCEELLREVYKQHKAPMLCPGLPVYIQSIHDNENYLFPSFIAIVIGGVFLSLSIYQISNTVLWRKRAIVMCSLNGGFDSSAVVFLIFKLIYDTGVKFSTILYIYSGLSLLLITFVTVFLVPSQIKLKKWSIEEEHYYKTSINDCIVPKKTIYASKINSAFERTGSNVSISSSHQVPSCQQVPLSQLVPLSQQVPTSLQMTSSQEILSSQHTPSSQQIPLCQQISLSQQLPSSQQTVYNFSVEKTENLTLDVSTLSSANGSILIDTQNIPPSVFRSIFSPLYMIELICLLSINLKLQCYIGSLQLNLERLTQNNLLEVSKYINIFGYLQFCGIVITPFIGLTFRRLKNSEKQSLKKEEILVSDLRSSIAPYCVLNFLGMIFCLFDLINSMKLQIPSYILCAIVRGFLYANHTTFIGIAFPSSQFGTLFGFSLLLAGIFALLQYALFHLTNHALGGKPFWSNFILLLLVSLGNAYPLYVWLYCRKKESKKSLVSTMKHSVVIEE
ncbi:large neutral amino acids transporter small subunit 4 isoform X2 [Hydra vulgaris]|uniref:large neutral amino acids transporter small subunit 4 isoform X2 n=1 Tax=Hydra vulgaris TaxID=6087 RepID=UPI001F5E6F90|nr:large neutral amino acids transporter small subunit 4 isoform X2 [Hydra vulgaris]